MSRAIRQWGPAVLLKIDEEDPEREKVHEAEAGEALDELGRAFREFRDVEIVARIAFSDEVRDLLDHFNDGWSKALDFDGGGSLRQARALTDETYARLVELARADLFRPTHQ